ncbi:MAG: hypothetical protein JWP83_5366 [Mycobacterium sp.]|jgi:hypothetical protein|uniref:hypothetical protein n=1 Tax=Mycobacterium sp. TaxID=1785 RepID=UPI00262BC1C9|nr:hypothetical protein [Mycobacterium sp.]MCW2664214.1 hypothetical protein [Mycobacterium sp.]
MTQTERPPAYTVEHPPTPSSDELRERIHGWGADLNPKDRPAEPKLRQDLSTGAHWDFPERQPEKWPRERSMEHRFLTPVFGTAQPPTGISGMLRRYAYKFSEGRAAHWMILLYADRVDAAEHHVRSLFTARPDNPFTETGIRGELTYHGIKSRLGRKRADLAHIWMDPIIVAGPWIPSGGVVAFMLSKAVKATAKAAKSRSRQ